MPAQVRPLLDTAARPSLARLDDSPAGPVVGLRCAVSASPLVPLGRAADWQSARPPGSGARHDLPADPEPVDIADVGRVHRESRATPRSCRPSWRSSLSLSGPDRSGSASYTQAELAVVLGDAPALRGSSPEVLAEAARSLAARGVLFRDPGLGPGHRGRRPGSGARAGDRADRHARDPPRTSRGRAANEPWRWLITVLPHGVVAIDRIDTLGLHRLSGALGRRAWPRLVADRSSDGAGSDPTGRASGCRSAPTRPASCSTRGTHPLAAAAAPARRATA